MNTTRNDGLGKGRAEPENQQCPPEGEQRIQEAVAFDLGEIFAAATEAAFDACEGRLRLFEERIARARGGAPSP